MDSQNCTINYNRVNVLVCLIEGLQCRAEVRFCVQHHPDPRAFFCIRVEEKEFILSESSGSYFCRAQDYIVYAPDPSSISQTINKAVEIANTYVKITT